MRSGRRVAVGFARRLAPTKKGNENESQVHISQCTHPRAQNLKGLNRGVTRVERGKPRRHAARRPDGDASRAASGACGLARARSLKGPRGAREGRGPAAGAAQPQNHRSNAVGDAPPAN
ncbi:unnamed protein product [Leptosia nina]|uniref:Uncharacterized protein n=1 Tax=Leptosia nina TaxID=320188 RepID=A0AAV1JVA9_9NEOP